MFEGVILAGGLSSRMGSDKATLPYGKGRLIDHMATLLSQCGLAKVRISGNFGTPDMLPQCGPVGGLCTMIGTSDNQKGWLFVPVDMPLLTPHLLRRLTDDASDADAVFFTSGSLPLLVRHAPVIRERAAQAMAELQAGDNFSVRGFIKPFKQAELAVTAFEQKQLVNLNTPEEWQQLKEQQHESAH